MSYADPIGYVDGDSFVLSSPWTGLIPSLGRLTLLPGWRGEASLPRLAWSILGLSPLSEPVLLPGLVHDWLYRTRSVSRVDADLIFYRMCREEGAQAHDARIMYRVLRLAGWCAWRRGTDAERAAALSLGYLVPA